MNTIIKPLVTEKTTTLANERKTYAFEVAEFATKPQIKQTLETIYKVKVSKVRIAIKKGKTKRIGRRMVPKQMPNKKIAYVSLKEGMFEFFPKA